jgi:hypothetical protein
MVGKNKRESPIEMQERYLLKYFPASRSWRPKKDLLVWEGELRPTPFSRYYIVRIKYAAGRFPTVFVVEPNRLALFPGEIQLPHVFSTVKQELCLFYPHDREWNGAMLIVNTTIRWAAEWLYFYEEWVSSGDWNGGGIHPEPKKII